MDERDYVEVRITVACNREESSSRSKVFSGVDSTVDELGNAIAKSIRGIDHPRPIQVLAQAVSNFSEISGMIEVENDFVEAALRYLKAWEEQNSEPEITFTKVMVD
jgi:hypothetical protein